jgi:hypothetical protein
MTEPEGNALERAAADLDPDASAEEKAARLRPELEKYARSSEAAENEDLHSDRSAPEHAAEGVAEHERDMVRRGFEQAGPPD